MADNTWQSCINQCDPGGATGSRLVTNPDPSIVGPPPAFTYTISPDEMLPFFEGPPGAYTLAITLPSIASMTPGQEVGVRLPGGNLFTEITFIPDAADLFIDPLTNTPPGPAGTPMVYPAGTFPAGARISWEGVAAPLLAWSPRWDQGSLAAGGAAGSYEATLALGQDSGVLGRYLNTGSKAVMGTDVASAPTPGVSGGAFTSYQYEGSFFTGALSAGGEGAGTYVLNTEIFENPTSGQFDGIAIVEWWVFRYATSGFNPQTMRGYGTAKETWNISFASSRVGAQRIPDVTQQSGFDIARVAPGVSPRSIAIEILDGSAVGTPLSAKVYYKVTFSNNTAGF